MSFTFSSLKQAIQDYSENAETTFVNNLDIFIKNTEERILKNIQLSLFRKNASGTLTSSNQFLNCPTDFLAPMSLSFTNASSEKVFLEFKDPDFVQTFAPNSSTTGTPKYYAVFDVTNFIIGPTPNSSFAVELNYFYRPASLTAGASSGTTWLSENAPMTMLYGSLVEAYTFMKGEPDIVGFYKTRYDEALEGLRQLADGRNKRDSYRNGEPRIM